jgi:hypothetical protein
VRARNKEKKNKEKEKKFLNFAGLKGRSEKSPCESGEMKAEPLRYYDKYITV